MHEANKVVVCDKCGKQNIGDCNCHELVNAWEVCPHYDPQYDVYLTDDKEQLKFAIECVLESFTDDPHDGELTIKVTHEELTRGQYEERFA